MEKLNMDDMMVVSGGDWFGYFCAGFGLSSAGASIAAYAVTGAVTGGVIGLAATSVVGISCAIYTFVG